MRLFGKIKSTTHRKYIFLGIRFNIRKKIKTQAGYFPDVVQIISIKKKLKDSPENIKNLCLGSSHARYDFVEDDISCNMGLGSQDLYYSWKLYEKYDQSFPNLKNVIIFYSIFSPGNVIEFGPHYQRAAEYKAFFDIDYRDEEFAKSKKLYKFEKIFLTRYYPKAQKFKITDPNYIDLRKIKNRKEKRNIPQLVDSLIKLNKSDNDQNVFLEKIINKAAQNNHNVYVVLSPCSSELEPFLPKEIDLWERLNKILKDNPRATLIDCFSDFSIAQDYFRDFDHLNKQGAELLTKTIFDKIKEDNSNNL